MGFVLWCNCNHPCFCGLRNQSGPTLILWLILDVVIVSLLFSALLTPEYAFQTIATGCGQPYSRLYYNLWNGIGTTPTCEGSDCLRWGNKNAWKLIDDISGSNMAYDRNLVTITQVQVFFIICFICEYS